MDSYGFITKTFLKVFYLVIYITGLLVIDISGVVIWMSVVHILISNYASFHICTDMIKVWGLSVNKASIKNAFFFIEIITIYILSMVIITFNSFPLELMYVLQALYPIRIYKKY